MKLSEFKAWFEGFTEGMDGPPSVAQFDRIKARVAEIDGFDLHVTSVAGNAYYDPAALKNYAVEGRSFDPHADTAAARALGKSYNLAEHCANQTFQTLGFIA